MQLDDMFYRFGKVKVDLSRDSNSYVMPNSENTNYSLPEKPNPAPPQLSAINFQIDPIKQIFLNQAYQHQTMRDHLNTLIGKRVQLHDKHVGEIRHRHYQFQEALSCARNLKSSDGGRRESNLEKVLLDLEEAKRNEELTLWKDLLDLQVKVMEEDRQYQGIMGRAKILTGGANG